jgi:hypothetical protein
MLGFRKLCRGSLRFRQGDLAHLAARRNEAHLPVIVKVSLTRLDFPLASWATIVAV